MNPFIKIIYINWPLQILILATALFGFLMLYSVSGGSWEPWTKPQINRFFVSFLLVFVMSVISISLWRKISPFSYILGLALLIAVYFYGDSGMGAKRWLDLYLFRFQPIELLKPFFILTTVKILTLDKLKNSQIKYLFSFLLLASVIILLIDQPDLGQSILLIGSWISLVFV